MKMIPWVAGVIGSYIGWFVGAKLGFFMGFVLSIVGAAVAGYYAHKWVRENLA